MPKIRTTFMPWKEIDVSDEEYVDLQRLGRVLDNTNATTEAGLVRAAERQNANDADKSQEG